MMTSSSPKGTALLTINSPLLQHMMHSCNEEEFRHSADHEGDTEEASSPGEYILGHAVSPKLFTQIV
jgi:hypothetical protein